MLSYNVVGLQRDSVYYYTVQPVDNPNIISNSIKVKTDITLGLRNNVVKSYTLTKSHQGVVIQHISPDSQCIVYDTNGTLIFKKLIQTDNLFVPLSKRGIYIFQFVNRQKTENIKYVF